MPYVKFWTEARGDSKYLSLNALQRGVFHQCIVVSKLQRDDGFVRWRNWSAMGSDLGCDGKTARRVAGILTEISLVMFKVDEFCNIEGFIPNYIKWQGYTAKDVVVKERKNPGKIPEKSGLLTYHSLAYHNTIAVDDTTHKEIKSKQEPSDIDRFVEIFNSECPTCIHWREITEPRKKLIARYLKKQPDLERWRMFFRNVIHRSDFLSGRKGAKSWSLDWILKPANYIKITEGQYDNKTRPIMSAADQYAQEDAVHRRNDAGGQARPVGDVLENIAEKYLEVSE